MPPRKTGTGRGKGSKQEKPAKSSKAATTRTKWAIPDDAFEGDEARSIGLTIKKQRARRAPEDKETPQKVAAKTDLRQLQGPYPGGDRPNPDSGTAGLCHGAKVLAGPLRLQCRW